MLLWWILLALTLVFGVVVSGRLRSRIERSSFVEIKRVTENRLHDIEKDFNFAVSLLKILGPEGQEEYFFKNSDKSLSYVREQLSATAVGVYDRNTENFRFSLDENFTNTVDQAALKKELEEVFERDDVTFCRGTAFFESGDVGIVVPLKKNGSTVALAFAFFYVDSYSDRISETILNGEGYSMLSDIDGQIIVPSEQFRAHEQQTGVEEDIMSDDVNALFEKMEAEGVAFGKIAREGKKFYVCSIPFENYPDYCIVAVVDEISVFQNITPATRGIIAVICMLLVVTVGQSIYYATTVWKKKNQFDDIMNYDELTGLPSKHYHKTIALNILKKAKGNFAYAACDVSEFKYFNSTFGYEYGNKVLKYIANVMSDALLKDETVSRTNGDHFALLLHYNDPDELTSRLTRILDTASILPAADDGRQPRAIFTCGVYLIGAETDINRIRARANVARKGLKRSISNQIAYYNEEDFNNELENHELQEDLLRAVANKELLVFLQPKYGISNEEVIGAEALVRWNHRTRGLLSPSIFIPIAEKIGLVKEIDFFVFNSVCRQLNQWKKEGKNIVPVSVNFSRTHLNDDDFVANLIKATKENDIEPRYLEIELTESAVYDEMERLLDIMYLIKEAGFGLSMDDFGSGYSSLHLLREMPVDVLKLDKGFLDDCDNDNQRERKVISHVISLAKDLQISVLAEGVETESQKNFLQEANCDMIQGYYYAKPMPMSEFSKYIEEEDK